jgi:hypothetical protein
MPEDVQDEDDNLQFAAVESATPGQTAAAPQCVVCKRPIIDAYFTAGDKVVCPDCRNDYEAALRSGSGFWRFVKATVLGILAGLLAAAAWFAIGYVLQAIFALAAIGVGLFVGGGVRAGSERRGGPGYQILAISLTYLALGLGFATLSLFSKQRPPATASSTRAATSQTSAAESDSTDDDEAPVRSSHRTGGQLATVIAVYSLTFIYVVVTSPVRVAFSGIIGAVIVAIALWEAWRINRSRRLTLTGPYSLAGQSLSIPQPLPPTTPGPR